MDPTSSNRATGVLTYDMWGDAPASSAQNSRVEECVYKTPEKQVGRHIGYECRKLPVLKVLNMIYYWQREATDEAWNTTLDINDYASDQVMECIQKRHRWAITKLAIMRQHLKTRPAPAPLVQVEPQSPR